ncbi:proteasome activator pa28 [Melampsora americana]|nr:proteasome activator pa28 [Melampsora americana]
MAPIITVEKSVPPPAVSGDLWTETADKKTRLALRAVSDDVLARASLAIKVSLPRKIIELTDMIGRSETDETSIFHPKWDTRWINTNAVLPKSPALINSFSVTGHTNIGSTGDQKTTRRFSITQQCSPVETAFSASVVRPPTHIVQLWEVLDTHTRQIIDFFDLVQTYLILKTPVAEEGNNTGVEIQQQCARTVVDARRFVVGCENYLKLYHTQRAKLASKCLKYPQIEDYQRALTERDHEECRDCRYLLARLRLQCLAVVDILHKNFEKVDDPKGLARGGASSVGMY